MSPPCPQRPPGPPPALSHNTHREYWTSKSDNSDVCFYEQLNTNTNFWQCRHELQKLQEVFLALTVWFLFLHEWISALEKFSGGCKLLWICIYGKGFFCIPTSLYLKHSVWALRSAKAISQQPYYRVHFDWKYTLSWTLSGSITIISYWTSNKSGNCVNQCMGWTINDSRVEKSKNHVFNLKSLKHG